jgi:hypothetical protein
MDDAVRHTALLDRGLASSQERGKTASDERGWLALVALVITIALAMGVASALSGSEPTPGFPDAPMAAWTAE